MRRTTLKAPLQPQHGELGSWGHGHRRPIQKPLHVCAKTDSSVANGVAVAYTKGEETKLSPQIGVLMTPKTFPSCRRDAMPDLLRKVTQYDPTWGPNLSPRTQNLINLSLAFSPSTLKIWSKPVHSFQSYLVTQQSHTGEDFMSRSHPNPREWPWRPKNFWTPSVF